MSSAETDIPKPFSGRGKTDSLEPVYQQWKAGKGPEANAQALQSLEPTIQQAIRTHVGQDDPITHSRARRMALEGLRRFDPERASLQTHLFNELKGLKRYAAQRSQPVRAPERVTLDRRLLDQTSQELEAELGRPPNDEEIAQKSGLSHDRMRYVRRYQPAVSEGSIVNRAAGEEDAGGFMPSVQNEASNAWLRFVYDDLGPEDRKIMEWSLGLNNQPVMSNQQIAQRLRRSPGAVSQRKQRIQQMIDSESELSPLV
jgi:DNA-directed RNA polymerase specialized sigma subunit